MFYIYLIFNGNYVFIYPDYKSFVIGSILSIWYLYLRLGHFDFTGMIQVKLVMLDFMDVVKDQYGN
jgi:hypothetical protein